MNTYSHTQFGTLMVLVFLAILPLTFLPAWLAGAGHVSWIGPLVLLLVLTAFYNLTVQIDAEHVRIRFGIGLIRKRFPLDQIASCRPVKNSWASGWGIRLTPNGWLFNVSGLDAVELKMQNGKTVRIGTDQPQALATAIEQALEARRTDA